MCSGLPVIAGSARDAGRGLFAVVDVPYAATLFTAQPVVCCPPVLARGGAASSCAHCLRPLSDQSAALGTGSSRFCCAKCQEGAASVLADETPGWQRFRALCADAGAVYPLLAARLAFSVARGAQRSDALDGLCFARGAVEHPPPEWLEQHAALAQALRDAMPGVVDPSAAWMTPGWYTGVLARLHLNAFRVDIPRMDISLADVVQHGSGTAVYLLPSLFNHECDPNVDAVWRHGDAQLTLAARRDIMAGEQLSISYIDADQPVAERRRELRHGYGFHCVCAACVEESGE